MESEIVVNTSLFLIRALSVLANNKCLSGPFQEILQTGMLV